MSLLRFIWGHGSELTPLQMADRAIVMFLIAIILIRISGMRTIGRKSAFDFIIVIMLGSVLARAVVGASPFFSTVAAGLAMSVLHRLLARLTMYYHWLGNLVKGKKRLLYKDGIMDWKKMKRCNLSENDLLQSLRLQLHQHSMDDIKEIYIERDGEISFIKKEKQDQ